MQTLIERTLSTLEGKSEATKSYQAFKARAKDPPQGQGQGFGLQGQGQRLTSLFPPLQLSGETCFLPPRLIVAHVTMYSLHYRAYDFG